ncbi:MAG TPA: sulfotransferase [Longimicrobiaceae bacterium]|nr:sulfotransferase [Longimicrobiaceae bacterium]
MRGTADSAGPDFVCIGAQKAGTTWLYDNLVGQRDVWVPPEKEIHFFNTVCANEELLGVEARRPAAGLRRYEPLLRSPSVHTIRWLRRFHGEPRTTRWYYSLFPPELVGDRKAGDFTPAYATLDERGVAYARRVLRPGCRVFLIVRNPIERAWSGLKMLYRWRGEELPLERVDALLREMDEPTHRLRGDYARTIRLWDDAFGDDFRVFRYERLASAPVEFLREVGEFLDVEIDVDLERLGRRSNSDPERKPMPDALRRKLVDAFRPQVEELDRYVPGVAEAWLRPAGDGGRAPAAAGAG